MPRGAKSRKFKIVGTSQGDFHVKIQLFDTKLMVHWVVVFVYGAAQDEHKQEFLTELVDVCSDPSILVLIGGDFSLLRSFEEKNMNFHSNRNYDTFSAIINTYGA